MSADRPIENRQDPREAFDSNFEPEFDDLELEWESMESEDALDYLENQESEADYDPEFDEDRGDLEYDSETDTFFDSYEE